MQYASRMSLLRVPETLTYRDALSGISRFLNGTHAPLGSTRLNDCLDVLGRDPETSTKVGGQTEEGVHSVQPRIWIPSNPREVALRESLIGQLTHPDIIDLIVFGSLARGTATPYSDVDAILIVANSAVGRRSAVADLRQRVIGANRAAIRFQPMQHHGLLIIPERALRNVTQTVSLPSQSLSCAVSLLGSAVSLRADANDPYAPDRLRDMCRSLAQLERWPAHIWELHRAISMFALLPALFLQATERPCPKHESFARVRDELSEDWHGYEALDAVRSKWEQRTFLSLSTGLVVARNPWVAVAAFRRIPARASSAIVRLLGLRSLENLQRIAARMMASAT